MTGWCAKYVGLPFADFDGPQGLRCWGLVVRVYREQLGIVLPDHGAIGAGDVLAAARAIHAARVAEPWVEVAPADRQAFDVVVMRGAPPHVGVMVDAERVLHVKRGAGAVQVRLDGFAYRAMVIGTYRHRARI